MSQKIKEWIDRLGQVWVEGEITQWQLRGGHVYGKLKDLDQDATVSFTVWRSVAQKLTSDFSQGDRVIALVKPDFWVKGGSLSVQVFDLSHVGLGELQLGSNAVVFGFGLGFFVIVGGFDGVESVKIVEALALVLLPAGIVAQLVEEVFVGAHGEEHWRFSGREGRSRWPWRAQQDRRAHGRECGR